jgi:hypothetical protein
MHTNLHHRLAVLLFAAVTLGACATDRPGVTAPAGASAGVAALSEEALDSVGGTVAELLQATTLTRKIALEADEWGAVYIDPKTGGSLELKQAGLSVSVPAGAVSQPMIIWAKAQAGTLVAYEFGPHGTQFLVPIKVKQDLKPTSWYKLVDRSQVEVGYFKEPSQVDHASGKARIDEFFPIDAVTQQNKIEFRIHHFSGYLLSTGKSKL